jgi:hypothetical protein
MKLYKVKDVKNKIYLVTTDILKAQLEVVTQIRKQHKEAEPLSIFISVKTV